MKKKVLLIFSAILISLTSAGIVDPKFDHSIWDKMLQTHVSSKGNVDYDGIKTEIWKLDSYLKKLANNPPKSDWGRNETMAYWINAYNAYTVKLILNNYPLKSIMSINGGNAWDLKFIKIGDQEYSLNNIEHDILRKKYKDARIHFAVNCASISCPRLNNKAFLAAELEKQLDKMATSFINNPSKNKVTPGAIEISQLFDWYKSDFMTQGDIIGYINKYSKNKTSTTSKVTYKEYNWNLNK